MSNDRPVPPRVDESSGFRAHALPEKYNPPNPIRPTDFTATRTVRIKESGAEAVINTTDFNPAVHEDPAAAPPGASALATLTVAQLTELAAEKKVGLGDASKKAEIIAALLAAGVTTP